MNNTAVKTHRPGRTLREAMVWALVLSSMISTPVLSAQTDISSSPITSTNAAQVKPNVMLLMDTSVSMGWTHMPDEAEEALGPGPYPPPYPVGYKAAQCNVLYYNRNQTYALPKRADGTDFPTPSFTSARYDAFDSIGAVVDLSSAFKAYDATSLRITGYNDTQQPAYYYYKTGGTVPITAYNSSPCLDLDQGATMASSDGGTWNRAVVGSNTGVGGSDERTNFAIWFSYYRKRIQLIKSAASLAFTPLTDSFRVGFITVSPKDNPTDAAINQDKYLAIDDFNTTQRGLWFTKLFSQTPGGSSPTREGLARVGRHYAGKQDGINTGMTGDPVQYSCQQNFTIMTTDGYWNDQGESSGLGGGFIGGGVDIDGKTLVGQRDGNLNAFSTNNPSPAPATDVNVTPRPIWDGQFDGTRTITAKNVSYAYVPCGSYFEVSTTQILQSTSQIVQETSQTRQATVQNLESTSQTLQSSDQLQRTTSQTRQSTTQRRESTRQNLRTTTQRLQTTSQTTQYTQQNRQATNQNLQNTTQALQATNQTVAVDTRTEKTVYTPRQSTTQNLQSTSQITQTTSQQNSQTVQATQSTAQRRESTSQTNRSTVQTTQSTSQNVRNTTQNLKSTSQATQSTMQNRETRSQNLATTSQTMQSTSQTTSSQSQVRRSTSQERSCPTSGESCNPGPPSSCTPSASNYCETATTGPTLVSTCSPATANAGNNWTTTTCVTNSTTPVGTASCTPQSANAGNGYTTTDCNTTSTGPAPVGSCNAASPNSGNNYTATSCSTTASSPTPVASCTPSSGTSGNNYTTTSCSTNNSGPTPVQSCTNQSPNGGNGYTTVSCGSTTTSNVPVASCTASGPTSPNWTTTTCNTNNTSNVPVSSCTNSSPTSGNGYTTTTCSTNDTNNVPVASCSPSGPTSPNWVTTTCGTNNVNNTPSGSCVASGPTSGNNYTTTTCGTVNGGPTPVNSATCSPATGSGGNSWTTTTCDTTTTTNVPVASCANQTAASGNAWTARTCSDNNTGPTPVASCAPSGASSGNAYTATTCGSNVGTATPVASCTPVAASAGNSYTATTCPVNNNGPTGVSSCSASGPTSGNNYTATMCGVSNTSNVPVASCTASSANGGNNWTTTSCATNNTTNTAVSSCTASGPTAGNGYTTTTCPPETLVSGPTTVGSCTPQPASAGNGYQRTDCNTVATSTPVAPGTCVPQSPNAGNGFVGRTCTTNNTPATPVASCTPQSPNAGNNYVEVLCSTNNTTNVPVATCTAQSANGANAYTTTTCPAPVTSGPTPVASCSPQAPSSGNNFTSTTCPTPVTTAATPVASCTYVPPTAGNNYVATLCGSNNTSNVAVQTCTASGPTGGNGYTTTSCADNNTVNEPVASCTASSATGGNGWTTTTCPAPIVTTNVPVDTCTAQPTASAGNNFTTKTCNNNNTSNVPSGSCVAATKNAGNNWTTTTCPVLVVGPTGVNSCTPAPGAAGNNWTTTTCNPASTSNIAVASCTPQSPTSGNGYLTVTCTPNTTSNVPVASCSAGPPTGANAYTTTTCSSNTSNVPAASCTPSGATSGNGFTTTTCPVILNTSGTASCTPSGPTSGNGYTTTTCPTNNTTGPTAVATCTPQTGNAGNGYTTVTCSSSRPAPTFSATCNPAVANPGNNFTSTNCDPVGGSQMATTITTRTRMFNVSGGSQSSTGTDTTVVDGPTTSGACYPPGDPAQPALPPDGPAAWTTADAGAHPSCTAYPCTEDVNTNDPRSINSLADVAQYYYITDLRTAANEPRGPDYFRDDVPGVGSGPEDDRVRWQHMTTFAVGLGVSGTLNYRPDYRTAATGDFADIRTGVKNWPLWPDPSLNYSAAAGGSPALYNDPRSIDDFWHAAVNGRGQYFSAGDPTSVIAGLSGALAGITSRLASATGVGVSNQQPVAGDNFAYLANYTTQSWTGEVEAHEVDVATGTVLPAVVWSAQTRLNADVNDACDNRKIFLFRNGATNNLADFTWNTFSCDVTGNPTGTAQNGLLASEQTNFSAANVGYLSQSPGLSPAQQTQAAGANMVNFLRGQRGFQDFQPGVPGKVFRARDAALGDTVNGQPVYVRAPFLQFSDTGYAAFKAANLSRPPMLYVPANDGMLHAFYAGASTTDTQGGKEAWAVIPSTVLPRLYKLADANYKNLHEYFVDGTPTVSDARLGGTWKTMLVGGLNGGGRGFYALDVTDPTTPKGLWEFKASSTCYAAGDPTTAGSDCHIGLSFGKPIITKLTSGQWVVLLTSGYNNVNATPQTGDGGGYLYVLDAATGQILYKISTGVGDPTTPSGLAQINNFVNKAEVNNTTERVYGTDLLGNLWRFDVNNNTPPSGREATLVGTAKDAGGTPQPITTRPELTEIGGKPLVFMATGKLLGATDTVDLQSQSIYGIVDPVVGTTAFTNLRSSLAPLVMTQVGSGATAYRTIACTGTTAQCGSTDGWRVDLPDNGERVNVQMILRDRTLIVGSNVPQIGACKAGGYGWLNFLDYKNGLAVNGSPNLSVSESISNSLIVGLTVIKVGGTSPSNNRILVSTVGGVVNRPGAFSLPSGTARRLSWREVVTTP